MNVYQIAMCYISMDLYQRALQTNEFISNYFSKFLPNTENFGQKPKNIQNNQIEM